MTAVLVLGTLSGVGLMLVATGLAPRPVPLSTALARLDRSRQINRTMANASLFARLAGGTLAGSRLGQAVALRFEQELRTANCTIDELCAKVLLAGICGLLWAPGLTALLALGGLSVDLWIPAWAALTMGVAAMTVPLVEVRARARTRRTGFRHALSCFLDLVAVRLAGGAGVESALTASADAGRGWAFGELRHALADARLMGEPPWSALDRLGHELGVVELNELAASAALAGNEGARVRTSITAKARAIRTRGLADAEAHAQAASERMSLPIVLLMVGFVVFLGYPAVIQVLNGL